MGKRQYGGVLVRLYYFDCASKMVALAMDFKNGSLMMLHVIRQALKSRIWRDSRGQDLIEYALMAGFVAVAAGAIMPGVASSINVIFSQVNSIMITAASS